MRAGVERTLTRIEAKLDPRGAGWRPTSVNCSRGRFNPFLVNFRPQEDKQNVVNQKYDADRDEQIVGKERKFRLADFMVNDGR